MVTAVRFDRGEVTKVERSDEGFLIVKGIATRTGVLTYKNPDGSIRNELRHPDDVLDPESLKTLAGKPLTLEHPPRLLTTSRKDISEYSTGSTSNRVQVVGDGLIEIVFNVHRGDAISSIESGERRELSAGYRCDVIDEIGVYQGIPYTHRQKNIRYNHVAATVKGRAGEIASFHMDSAECSDVAVEDSRCEWIFKSVNTATRRDFEQQGKRMATIRIDGAEYSDVSETVAAVVAQKITRLDALEKQITTYEANSGSLQARIDTLEDELETRTQERDREAGRAFALESELEDAKYELEELKTEGEKPEETPRTDSADEATIEQRIQAGVKERVDALDDARSLVSQLEEKGVTVPEIKLDSSMTPAEVQKTVVTALNPGVTIEDDEVKGFYRALKNNSQPRTDSVATHHADMLELAVGAASKKGKGKGKGGDGDGDECTDSCKKRMDNYRKPLAMTKG